MNTNMDRTQARRSFLRSQSHYFRIHLVDIYRTTGRHSIAFAEQDDDSFSVRFLQVFSQVLVVDVIVLAGHMRTALP